MLGRSALWSHVLLILTHNVVTGQQLQPRTFQWGPALNQSSLTQCGTVNLMVYALNGSTGTPPYYMFAYQPGGPTTSSLIGSDPNNLLWTVDHAAESVVVLQVADSQGSTGGVGPTSYTVNPGSSSSCIPPSTSSVQLTPSTNQLSTCDPLVLDISGGEMPYQLTILSVNDPAVTNITMGPSDNEYTYIDRLTPGNGLVAAVVDATGTWSTATDLIGLSGNTDTSCGGAQSSSGIKGTTSSSATTSRGSTSGQQSSTSSSSSAAESSTSPAAATSSSKHSIIGPVVGGVVGALVVGVFGTILLICCFRRRKHPEVDYIADSEKKPDPVLSDNPSALPYANGAPTEAWAGNNFSSYGPQSQGNAPFMGFVGGVNGYTHQWYNPQESQAIAAGETAPFAYYQPTHSPSNSMSYSSDRSSRGLLEHQNGVNQDFAQHNYPQPSTPYNAATGMGHTGITPLVPADMSVSPVPSNARTLYDIPQGAMAPNPQAPAQHFAQGEREHHSDTPFPRPPAYTGVPEIQDDSHRTRAF